MSAAPAAITCDQAAAMVRADIARFTGEYKQYTAEQLAAAWDIARTHDDGFCEAHGW